ncbi:MAG: FecR domain-containing protein [Myxococcota bacterium]
MRDALEQLGALAHERAAAEPTEQEHAEGRQRIMRHAADGSALRTRSWKRPALLGSLAAAAAIALVFGVLRTRPLDFVVSGADSHASNYLSAPADHSAEVRFTDGSLIEAEPGTRLRIDQTRPHGARVLVERGVATASVKHAGRSDWQFVAGPFEVHVTGTKLTLGWDPLKEEVDLQLHEGSVEVESPLARGRFAVRAGQRFRASLADGSMRVESVTANAKLPNDVAAALNESERAISQAAKAEPSASPSALVEARPALHSKANLNTPPNQAADAPRESWPELVRRGQFQTVVRAAEARGIDACLASCSAADVRALADAARYTAQAGLAEKSLLALRRRFPSTTEGSAAAFLLGRISASRGQSASADSWYETYLRESPRGQFAPDALAGRMRAVAALKGNAAAKPLALEYLRSYPDGVHAPAARKLGGLD